MKHIKNILTFTLIFGIFFSLIGLMWCGITKDFSNKQIKYFAQYQLQQEGYRDIVLNDVKTFECPTDMNTAWPIHSVGFTASRYDGSKFIGNECVSQALFGVAVYTEFKEVK